MTEQVTTKLSKSKKWIDYSSEEENQPYEDEKLEQQLQQLNIKQSHSQKQNPNYLPVLSTSHQPPNKHLLDNKKNLLQQLRQIKGNSLWIQLSVPNQNSFDYLKQQIQSLKKSSSKDIINVYLSKDNKNAYDLRVTTDLCEKWIVEGFDNKNIINLDFRKKIQRQRQPRYQSKNQDYRPIKQYQAQHTTSTRYQPKYAEKKKYVEKNAETEKLEQKVQEELNERKLQKKDKSKKEKGSKFYSKNPFEEFNDSD